MPATWQDNGALKDCGPLRLAARRGLANWRLDAALQHGLIPRPDVDGRRWLVAVAHPLAEHVRGPRAWDARAAATVAAVAAARRAPDRAPRPGGEA
jgi:hypothetical protein